MAKREQMVHGLMEHVHIYTSDGHVLDAAAEGEHGALISLLPVMMRLRSFHYSRIRC